MSDPLSQHDYGHLQDDDGSISKGEQKKISWMTAGQLMVVDVVGVGVLGLSSGMTDLGWDLGSVFLVLFYPLNLYCGMVLWRAIMDKPQYRNIGSFQSFAQELGGPLFAFIVGFSVYFIMLLIISDYLLVVGESLGIVFYDKYICKREWILIGALPILALTQIRGFADMRGLLWFNMATITLTIIVSLSYVGSLGTDSSITPGEGPEAVASTLTALTFANAMAKFAFAYAGQFIYLEFMSHMANPQDFPKALVRFAGPYQLTIYVICGCVGYYLKGQNATGLMVNWIPFNGWLRFAALLLFLHVIIVYLIKAQILAQMFHKLLVPKTFDDTGVEGKLHWFGITLCILIFSIFIAQIIPFFDSLTSFIGASLIPITNWMLPIIFFIMVKKKQGIHWAEWILLIFILLLGSILTVVGTYSSWKDIADNWGTFGYPFSCGCEGVWNTCDCSSDHTGMEC